MPTWNDIVSEIVATGSTHDSVRRRYLKRLSGVTKRNTIIYYSGWLQKADLYRQQPFEFVVNDADKNGLMATIHQMDRAKGLDLILHTPGGDMAATESLVDYLRQMFNRDIRAIVPQLAMSAGTMIALACKEVMMGKHSNLGPIDPQIGGVPAHAVKEEFEKALQQVQVAPATAPLWQIVLSKYGPAQISESQRVISWADTMTRQWLASGMFAGEPNAAQNVDRIMNELGSHAITLSHSRHISAQAAKDLGLKIVMLEDDQKLQDAVLSVHHAAIITLSSTPAMKIIENDAGIAQIFAAQQLVVMGKAP